MKKTLKITGKVLLGILLTLVGLILISAITHKILKSIEKSKYKLESII